METDLTVGTEVLVFGTHRGRDGEPVDGVITKVGHKYIWIRYWSERHEEAFLPTGERHGTNYGSGVRFKTKAEWTATVALRARRSAVAEVLARHQLHADHGADLATIEKVAAMLESEED